MEIKKDVEEKIHRFVQNLIKTELDLTILEPSLERDEDYRIYIAPVNLQSSMKYLYAIYKEMLVKYEISQTGGSYFLRHLDSKWVDWNGDSNGHFLPFGQYEFDLEGNLLTQGRYVLFHRLAIGQEFDSIGTKLRKIEPEMYDNMDEVQYNSLILSGPRTGEKHKMIESAVVLVGKE
ncbi:MAG: hypothetical protein GTN82_15595 [Candidatus Aminicenantes bacterium]|nr:hypothetical protein [Candidatus Aminicenantes bacterium]